MDKTEPVTVHFIQAQPEDSTELALLAEKVWRQHFTPLIGIDQVNYMLENFQSPAAIANFINTGYEYFFIQVNKKNIGYLAIHPRENCLHLSKFYILSEFRGLGYGKKSMSFIKSKAIEHGLNKLQLVVNKENLDAIAIYKKMGFKIVSSPVTDIGGGFVMDDYEFMLTLNTEH